MPKSQSKLSPTSPQLWASNWLFIIFSAAPNWNIPSAQVTMKKRILPKKKHKIGKNALIQDTSVTHDKSN